MTISLGIIALLILICFAAFLAASETALLRVSRIRVRYLMEKKVKKSEKLDRLITDTDFFLPPLLLMVLIVQVTSASLATYLATKISGSPGVGVLAGTATVTVLMFIFGELVPKAAAARDPEKVALSVTRPVSFLSRILHPLAVFFQWIANGVLRILGMKIRAGAGSIVTDEGEIRALVTAAEEHDIIEEEEKEMIHSIFEFGDTMVREVMVPRPDMVTLPATSTVRDALMLTIDYGYSRIPVYEKELDDIVGVLYAKDLMKYFREENMDHAVREIVRESYIIPETKPLDDLLRELQKRKVHMAIVVDEYGTVVGLVTIEDLLEEIVGEIFDEFDPEVRFIEKVTSNQYLIDGRLSIDELNELAESDLPSEDVDSVGGLIMKALGEVPKPGSTFVLDGIKFTVERVRNNRVSKVMVELKKATEPTGE
jgi:putative hemolysin